MIELPTDTSRLRRMLDQARADGDRDLALAIFAALLVRREFATAKHRARRPL